MQWTKIILILSLRFFKCFAEPCAVFNFPSVHNGTITLKDNTPVTLLFGLLNETCSEEDFKNIEIIVTKTDNSGSGGGTYCSIRRLKGKCVGTEHCKCLGSPDKYSFSKEVDKSDKTVWVWSTKNQLAEKKEIIFNVESITYKRQRTAATTENIDTDTDGYISNTDLLGTSDTNPVQGREENDHANVDSGNRNGGLRRARRYDVMFRRRSPITSEHLYDDARPLSMPEEPAPMRPIPKPRRNRQVQISENRDYLSLVADNFDSFEDGNEQLIGSEQAEP
ncbi:hypothetical protein BaRGS_00035235 [Batillaria attramentaria]|uniref:Uncharacterized protein n=1 Tax=Batillaria attramentaria TaxID=370345 RepID=A0ABD0JFA5_9CAEN